MTLPDTPSRLPYSIPPLTARRLSVHYPFYACPQAWKLGWRVRVRCLWGAAQGQRRTIECNTSADLDMHTLVWTRGEAFPLDQLESRMRCPRCGSRRVTVLFEVPNQPKAAAR